MATIVKILSVVDTREYEEGPDDKWYPIPGSGREHQCYRCGRLHEIHAEVLLDDGKTVVVGTGCMKESSTELPMAKRALSILNSTRTLRRLENELAKVRESLSAWDTAWVEVSAYPLPEVEETTCFGKLALRMGDSVPVAVFRGDIREQMDRLVFSWRQNRMKEIGFGRYGARPIDYTNDLNIRIEKTRARIAAAYSED